jgi:hypothetical protein
METTTIILISFVVFVVVALTFVSRYMNKPSDNKVSEPEEPEMTERFYFGKYVGGMPNFEEEAPLVFCGVTENDFVFRRGTKGVVIGSIPRDQLNNTIACKLSDITERLTADNNNGAFSKLQQSKSNKYGVIIDWNNAGERQNTVFDINESDSESAAQDAAQKLLQWAKQPSC